MISRSDWEPLPTPTLSPFCTRVPFSVSVFTAAVWCVPALRVPLVHSLINHFRQIYRHVNDSVRGEANGLSISSRPLLGCSAEKSKACVRVQSEYSTNT